MSYASALVLVGLAAVFLVVGIVSKSVPAFILAIIVSAIAVGLLLRRVRNKRVNTFVSEAPPRVDPAWLRGADALSRVDDSQLPVELEIDHVIDGYRSLVAAEVLPTLETLSVDELRKVINVERSGRNRQAIIRRAEVLIDLTDGSHAQHQAVVDPDAPTTRRRSIGAGAGRAPRSKSQVKSQERDDPRSLRKSGPDLTL